MKKMYVWVLLDENNNLLAKGRKKDVVKVLYPRFTYCRIYTDKLYRTNEIYKKGV